MTLFTAETGVRVGKISETGGGVSKSFNAVVEVNNIYDAEVSQCLIWS